MQKILKHVVLGVCSTIIGTEAYAGLKMGPFVTRLTDNVKTNRGTYKKAQVGRYIYLGAIPKVPANDINLIVSKMGLTLRSEAWISQATMDNFRANLIKRYNNIASAFESKYIRPYPLVDITLYKENFFTGQYKDGWEKWFKIIEQYSEHVLEKNFSHLFISKLDEKVGDSKYKADFLKGLKSYLLENDLSDPLNKQKSRDLFYKHHKKDFISRVDKVGYIGVLNKVYPVSAIRNKVSLEGSIPKSRVAKLMSYSHMDARWWSDKHKFAFGGLPFILSTPTSVAFHGPVTLKKYANIWFLKRGYVSGGCQRMDSSDLLELRAMLPKSTKEFKNVNLIVLNSFDTYDFNQDGELEVVDIEYYETPTYAGAISADDYLVKNQRYSFWQGHKYAKSFYNSDQHTFSGITKYKRDSFGGYIGNGNKYLPRPVSVGKWENIQIESRPYPKSRIIQYDELTNSGKVVRKHGYDDRSGNFPPRYFFQF